MDLNSHFEVVKKKKKKRVFFFYLVGIHIVAVLGCQCPAHCQVDDIPDYCQGEGCAQHVIPLTHCWQDRSRETGN